MASEISLIWEILVLKNKLRLNSRPGTQKIDMAGDDITEHVQNIPTTAGGTAITITPAAAIRWGYFMNIDPTNFIQIGVRDGGGTFIPFAKLLPGESFPMPAATDNLYALADTATSKLKSGFAEN